MSEIEYAQLHSELFRRRHSTRQSHGLFALAKPLLKFMYPRHEWCNDRDLRLLEARFSTVWKLVSFSKKSRLHHCLCTEQSIPQLSRKFTTYFLSKLLLFIAIIARLWYSQIWVRLKAVANTSINESQTGKRMRLSRKIVTVYSNIATWYASLSHHVSVMLTLRFEV